MHDRGGKLAALSLDKGDISTRFPIVCGANKEGLGITPHRKPEEEIANSALPATLSQGP